jgi:hypothetical protein
VFVTIEIGTSTRLIRFDGDQQREVFGSEQNIFTSATTVGGELFLGDQGKKQILRVSPAGDFLGVFASPNIFPAYLGSDSKGNIYASSEGIDNLPSIRLDATGALTQSFVGRNFKGIDADAAGNVYVADYLSDALLKFDANGKYLNSTSLAFSPCDIAVDEVGRRLFVTAPFSDEAGIKVFDISAATPSYLQTIATPPSAFMYGIHFATESGHLFATDWGTFSHDPRGLEFGSDGALIHEYRPQWQGPFAVGDIVTYVPEPNCRMVGMLAVALGMPRLCRRRL